MASYSQESEFRKAMESDQTEAADQPAMMGGEMRCPMCGASADKIVQAAQPSAPPEAGGMMGGMGEMK